MFCSKCGKTLAFDAQQCPFCEHPVGASRFEGSPYTSAQAHILPGSSEQAPVTQAYTRTNYTSKGEAPVEGDVDTRTTYRPVFEGGSAPEDIRKDMREEMYGSEEPEAEEPAEQQPAVAMEDLSEETRQTIEAMDKQLKMDDTVDLSKFRARPIKSAGQTGISSDVSEFIQKLESDQQRRPARRGRIVREAYDEYEDTAASEAPVSDDEQPDVFDDIDDEEFDELRHSSFGVKQVLKVAIALVVAAALFVGGVMWFRYIRGNQSSSPIEMVREELYDGGVALVKAHAETTYAEEMLQAFTAEDGGLAALTMKLQESANTINALLPEEATENEQLFVKALQKIESNIANCIMSDALAVSTNDTAAIAESDERWQVVSNSIAMLEASKQAAELTAIVNGEEVAIPEAEATPSPTPAVNYNTLSKGAKSDEVLDMQNRLFELGFFLDDRDGAFGSKTQTAVKMFQQAAGLPISGIADGATLAALYSDEAPRTEYAQPTPTPAPAAAPEPTADPAAEAAANAGEGGEAAPVE